MRFPKSIMLSSLGCLILSAATAAASSLTISVPSSNFLPNPHVLHAGTHATLTTLPSPEGSQSSPRQSNVLTAPLTRFSTFVFCNLQPESYLLDIRSSEYVFAPYRVDISSDGSVRGVWETFRGNPWDNRGAEKFVAGSANVACGDVAVEAKVLGRRKFYEERPKCEFYLLFIYFFFFQFWALPPPYMCSLPRYFSGSVTD